MTTDERPKAVALVRRDVAVSVVDLYALAERHGYRLVFTVFTDSGPKVAALALARHAGEHGAAAVVVPGFEHVDAIRHLVTDNAALITPMRLYPRGHRWVGEPDGHEQQVNG
ncbi:hypothetical protein [Nocardia speluncae]|uniref:hypothetical protein n=1 Tax=Nocardia speluncae TaxID=419477 RepID=UPI00082E8D26|nr:hypothetical protein [Nocardia speluncae]